MERRHGALEVPVHLFLSRRHTVGLMAKDAPVVPQLTGTIDLSSRAVVSPSIELIPTSQTGKNKSKPLVPRAANPIPVPAIKPSTGHSKSQLFGTLSILTTYLWSAANTTTRNSVSSPSI